RSRRAPRPSRTPVKGAECRVQPGGGVCLTEASSGGACGAEQVRRARRKQMRYVGGVRRDSIHVELLRALAFAPERTPANARELAEVLGTSVQFVAAKLRPLVSAGLVSRHWGSVTDPAAHT